MYDVRLPDVDRFRKRGDLDRLLQADPAGEQGLILFYGASNFTRWSARYGVSGPEEEIRRKDGGRAVVNHGFGGATSEELLYYYGRLVRPWRPRALVLAGFGNGLSFGYGAGEIMALNDRVLDWARHDFPGIRLYLCQLLPNARPRAPGVPATNGEFNELVRDYCMRHEDTTLADVTAFPGFWQEGHAGDYERPRPELFAEDRLHFNRTGYAVYRDFFLQVLDDIL